MNGDAAVDLSRAIWRKSSRSPNNANCVEVAEIRGAWRKSSRSPSNSNCVKVADRGDAVAVRDSKNPDGPVLAVTPAHWRAFLADAKADAFDR